MATLDPSPVVPSGRVVGRFVVGMVDGADLNDEPDLIGASGTLEFIPSPTYMPMPTGGPDPYVLLPETFIAILDSEGYVCTPNPLSPSSAGARGIRLFATDNQDTVHDWTWRVIPRFTGTKATIPAFNISVPTGSVVDLATAVKMPQSSGIGTEQVIALASSAQFSARTAAEHAALAIDEAASAGVSAYEASLLAAQALAVSRALEQRLEDGEFGSGSGGAGPARVARVRVESGEETRPTSDFVMWVGGTARPVNMSEGDIWFSEGAPKPLEPVGISSSSLTTMVVGVTFEQALSASGGTGTYSWSATGLPAGITLDAGSGRLSGTPAATGSGSATISVSSGSDSSSKAFGWTVSAAATAPEILAAPILPAMSVGSAVSWSPGRTGSTPMTWGVSAGSLPVGLSQNSSTGSVSGTPTTAGAFNFTLQATNSVGSNTRPFSGTVAEGATPTVRSIFGTTNPGTLTSHDDAGGGSWLAQQFYVPASGVSMSNASIVGARIYVPAGSPIIGMTWRIGLVRLTGSLGLMRWGGPDFGGQDVLNSNGALTQGPALKAGWNELLFSQEWPGLNNLEGVVIGAQIGDGSRYLFNTTLPVTAIPSVDPALNLVMAEAGLTSGEFVRSFYRGSPASGAVRWYGIDIMVRTAQ